MCLINILLLQKIEDEINCILKTKGPFMRIMLLNEAVKHPLFKPNFDIDFFLFILDFSISLLFNKHKFP
jgi:hypothetical protein